MDVQHLIISLMSVLSIKHILETFFYHKEFGKVFISIPLSDVYKYYTRIFIQLSSIILYVIK
jgi:hypothetical protein